MHTRKWKNFLWNNWASPKYLKNERGKSLDVSPDTLPTLPNVACLKELLGALFNVILCMHLWFEIKKKKPNLRETVWMACCQFGSLWIGSGLI